LQPGAFTDFNTVSTNSFRFKGRGLGVFSYSPNLEILAGVEYLNRDDIKILPAGGVIWTPTPDVRYEILFPYPKLARRLKTIGTTDWWGYVAGEYGGGAWKVSRANGTGDSADYGDLRLIFGLEWQGLSEINGYFEVGYVFERELQYTSGTPSFRPNDAVMLRAGLNY